MRDASLMNLSISCSNFNRKFLSLGFLRAASKKDSTPSIVSGGRQDFVGVGWRLKMGGYGVMGRGGIFRKKPIVLNAAAVEQNRFGDAEGPDTDRRCGVILWR